MGQGGTKRFLDPVTDPSPVEIVEATRRDDILLVCEHAGLAVPRRLDLGVSEDAMERHIACDIGAESLARALTERLGCALILQRYSRLVIDCNRPPGGVQSMPEISDGVEIPANQPPQDAAARIAEIFDPFAQACRARIAAPEIRAAFSIHSFEPVMGGVARPWDLGLLYRAPCSGGDALAEAAAAPGLVIGRNEPYRIEDETDWFIPCCAEPRGIPHTLFEVRNDHLRSPAGITQWADRLRDLLGPFCDRLAPSTPER